MNDIELYQQILGLTSPWKVQAVTLKREAGEIEVSVICTEKMWGCPTCGQRMHVHDHTARRWRHLDSCQFKTFLAADVPVVECSEHGAQTVQVPWAPPYGRFTSLMERLAIDILRECSTNGACEILGISWEEADGIKQRAVKLGLLRKTEQPLQRLGVDEKSAGRGQDYVTVVARLEPGQPARVEYVGDGRTRQALDSFWTRLSTLQRGQVQAIAMDMWDPYRDSTLQHVPGAAEKIVHDPFHIAMHLNEAVDTVRRQEHRQLLEAGDQRLSGTKFHWLRGWENIPQSQQAAFSLLKGQKLKTSRAWALKEMFRDFWSSADASQGRAFFQRWHSWAIRCRLDPIKKVARMLKKRLDNVLTFFTHRITNAALEGLNSRIAGLIKKACGYRNRERFKTDILFHLGGLDLYPAQ